MNTPWIQKLQSALIRVALALACSNSGVFSPATQAMARSEGIATIVARFEQELPAAMQADGTPDL